MNGLTGEIRVDVLDDHFESSNDSDEEKLLGKEISDFAKFVHEIQTGVNDVVEASQRDRSSQTRKKREESHKHHVYKSERNIVAWGIFRLTSTSILMVWVMGLIWSIVHVSSPRSTFDKLVMVEHHNNVS